ncbi:MAG: zinc ribbon domain-containing protein, partial [Acidimicrobiales bacterium]
QLLRSPRIAGLSVLNGVVIGDGGWEPILDRRTWELVCAALDGRHGRRRDTGTRRSLLGGIVVCGHEAGGQVCGRRLYRSVRGGYPVYVCRTETQTLGHVAISATPVEQMAESYARARLADPRVRAEVAARLSGAGAAMAEITREIDGIEAQMRDTEAGMSAVGARAQAAALRVIDDLDTQLGAARARLAALSPVALPREGQWPTDIERRSALIRLVVARMVVSPASRRGGRFDRSRVRIDPE